MGTNYKPISDTPEFLAWYSAYPRKQNRGDAKKAWEQTKELRPPIQQMLKALAVQRASDKWREDSGRYVPMPASYLRGERWDDVTEVEMEQVTHEGVMWWETNNGIERKAKEMGEEWDARTETWLAFIERLKRKAKVVPIQEPRQVSV